MAPLYMGWDLYRLNITHSPHLPCCISLEYAQSNMTPDNIFWNPCWHIPDKPFVCVNCLHRCRHLWTGCSYSWICTTLPCMRIAFFMFPQADPSGRTVWGVDLRPFACWECGFESGQGHGRCVLLGRGLCIRLIIHPEKSYWLWCVKWVLSQSTVRAGHNPELGQRAREKI
jgi:hypothetical protein